MRYSLSFGTPPKSAGIHPRPLYKLKISRMTIEGFINALYDFSFSENPLALIKDLSSPNPQFPNGKFTLIELNG